MSMYGIQQIQNADFRLIISVLEELFLISKKVKIKRFFVIAILAVLIILCGFLFINIKNLFAQQETMELESLDVIYNNIYIRGEAVGGLTVPQAEEMLNKSINGDYTDDKTLIFRAPNTDYEKVFTYPELGMGFDVEGAVNQAYNIGRDGDSSTNRDTIAELDVGGRYIDAEVSYTIDSVKACLATIEDEVNEALAPQGKVMDIDRTAKAADEMLRVNEYDALIYIATK